MVDEIQPCEQRIDTTAVQLCDLIKVYQPNDLQDLLDGFQCSRNIDVQTFLRKDSLQYEASDKSRTYCIVTTQSYEDPDSALDIVGYFTIALKNVVLDNQITKSKRKKITGMFPSDDVVVYLIGQLAKNDNTANPIHGSALLEDALRKIKQIQISIGGRIAMVECDFIPKLIDFYIRSGFQHLQNDSSDHMAQLFHFLD
ncbi:MAG: acetyltransferase [Armatimonadota bacterium]